MPPYCISSEKAHHKTFRASRIEDKAMSNRPSPLRLPSQIHNIADVDETSFKELERASLLLEDLLPNIKSDREKKLCRELVQTYRTAASRLLRRTWSDEDGQDIAEYAVMLAVILVIVVGTLRLIGTSANNAFSAAASSIQ
jgi:Flp pilus assembly pilin Flp